MINKFCSCPSCRVVMDMQSMIEFDELTGHEDDYKQIFKELVEKHFKEGEGIEADKITKLETA